ncbi:hypothetical protein EON65_16115 [archaeon]|nr:MAG: hypothetical protein EON65_16115 [archaeon]
MKPASMVTTSSEPDPNNIGYLQLLGCLQQMDLPHKNTMAARIEGVKEEVGIMEKHGKTGVVSIYVTIHVVFLLILLCLIRLCKVIDVLCLVYLLYVYKPIAFTFNIHIHIRTP